MSIVSASVQQTKILSKLDDEVGFALNGAVYNHNEGMYAPANPLPDFNYNINDSRQKLTVWVGLCANGDRLGPFFF